MEQPGGGSGKFGGGVVDEDQVEGPPSDHSDSEDDDFDDDDDITVDFKADESAGRKFFVGGSWKTNGDKKSIDGIIDFMNNADFLPPECVEIVVAPPQQYIEYVREKINPRFEIMILSEIEDGQISLEDLKNMGAAWMIVGDSERRHVIKESDEVLGQKMAQALGEGLGVVYCIGETMEEREHEKTKNVLHKHLQAALDQKIDWTNVVIAYEPVWAIGTGKTATPAQAQEVHVWVRDWVREKVSVGVGNNIRIIFGGSVTVGNCRELSSKPDIDGFLVGGESLMPEFVQLCNANVF